LFQNEVFTVALPERGNNVGRTQVNVRLPLAISQLFPLAAAGFLLGAAVLGALAGLGPNADCRVEIFAQTNGLALTEFLLSPFALQKQFFFIVRGAKADIHRTVLSGVRFWTAPSRARLLPSGSPRRSKQLAATHTIQKPSPQNPRSHRPPFRACGLLI
jgi:hypothetical protein